MSESLSRRELIGAAGVAAAGSLNILPVHSETVSKPIRRLKNDNLVLGLIGCGGMGRGNMENAMNHGAEIAAVCDVDTQHSADAARQVLRKDDKEPKQFKDFRKLLEMKEIDAVIIGTPDHWHALPFIAACEAGKDSYQEKPISHSIVEANAMTAAAKRFGRIAQVGTWQRSQPEFIAAVDYVRSGKLGKITTIRAWKTDDFHMGKNAPKDPPAALDYDFWVGPAAMEPYRDKHTHFDWRWYYNYAAGMTGDWGVHMMDICLLGMSKDTDLVMPTEVSAYGGKLAWPDDDRTTPDTHVSIMKFENPGMVLHWETGRKGLDYGNTKQVPGGDGGPAKSVREVLDHGSEFIGADGSSVVVWRGGWVIRNADGSERPKPPQPEVPGGFDHMQNWFDCMKSRQQPRSNIYSMAQTTIVCHLANVAYQANAPVRWDKAKMDLVGSTGKDTITYHREYRRKTKSGDWQLKTYKS
jgi:predicted dehydrogenase